MRNGQDAQRAGRRGEQGSVLVLAAFAAGALILCAALALDVGFVWASRTQSQSVADAVALAAAMDMHSEPDSCSVNYSAAQVEATNYAQANSTVANRSVTVQNADIEFGTWDTVSETLVVHSPPTTVPNQLTGVRITVHQDGISNARSPALLAGVGGFTGFDVATSATAYIGFEGSFDAREFDLPLAVDSCLVSSSPSGCSGLNYCNGGPTLLGCLLDSPQAPDAGVLFSCLQLAPLPSPPPTVNVPGDLCWTNFDPNAPVSSTDMVGLVQNGHSQPLVAGAMAHVDDGGNVPFAAMQEIQNQFLANGTDAYFPPLGPDSWVVKLPVVECQDATNCDSGSTSEIKGGICFEIREVVPAAHLIRGRFLCPCDPAHQSAWSRCKNTLGDSPGGCDFGMRAERPVLVE